jgi:DNA mismatch endonuclease, patch repair protein
MLRNDTEGSWVDRLSQTDRSKLMRLVPSKDTKPEMAVRRLVHSLGFRYRLHGSRLPGTPDLVLRRLKRAIFVHGCFWHRHAGCKKASTPSTNRPFWKAKFIANKLRDKRNIRELQELGWRVLVVWECETRFPEKLTRRLRRELEKD